MKVLLTGSANGQLHSELLHTCPSGVALCETNPRLDITDAAAVRERLLAERPDVVINAAAYTAVDRAETELDLAMAVNATGVQHLADAAKAINAHLIHVSTDFVFGPGHYQPIATDARTDPLGVYGMTKRAGEERVLDTLGERGLVMRTAWVYSQTGNNFVKTMLRLMRERDELGIVADQIGSPTWARSLAVALWRAAAQRAHGLMHMTGAGVASWYDFAVAILEEGSAAGLIPTNGDVPAVRLRALATADYPTPAQRPHYSVLETATTRQALELPCVHWRTELRQMLRTMT